MLVQVSARLLESPAFCPCCGTAADSEWQFAYTRVTGKRVIRETTRGWTLPYCSACIAHATAWHKWGAGASLTAVIGAFITLAAFASNAGAGFVALLMTAAVAAVLHSRYQRKVKATMCSADCATPDWAVVYQGWDGTVQSFDFASARYAAVFASANRSKLVSPNSQLRSTIEQSLTPYIPETIRGFAGPPMPPVRVPAPDATQHRLLHWIDKIESLKGPVARRNALERGLKQLSDPADQQRLTVEAAKIEVRAVLDKVDSLKTARSKRRHLTAAIEQLRNNPIPDSLYARELEMLEQALSELEPQPGKGPG